MSDAASTQNQIYIATARMAAALSCAPSPGTEGYVVFEKAFYAEFKKGWHVFRDAPQMVRASLCVPALLFSAAREYAESPNHPDLRRIKADDPQIDAYRRKVHVVPAPPAQDGLGEKQWWAATAQVAPAAAAGKTTRRVPTPEPSTSKRAGTKRKSSVERDREAAPAKSVKPSRQADASSQSRLRQPTVAAPPSAASPLTPPRIGPPKRALRSKVQPPAKPSSTAKAVNNSGDEWRVKAPTRKVYVMAPSRTGASGGTKAATGGKKRMRDDMEEPEANNEEGVDDENEDEDDEDEDDEGEDGENEDEGAQSRRGEKKGLGKTSTRRTTRAKAGTDKEKQKEVSTKAELEAAKIAAATACAKASVVPCGQCITNKTICEVSPAYFGRCMRCARLKLKCSLTPRTPAGKTITGHKYVTEAATKFHDYVDECMRNKVAPPTECVFVRELGFLHQNDEGALVLPGGQSFEDYKNDKAAAAGRATEASAPPKKKRAKRNPRLERTSPPVDVNGEEIPPIAVARPSQAKLREEQQQAELAAQLAAHPPRYVFVRDKEELWQEYKNAAIAEAKKLGESAPEACASKPRREPSRDVSSPLTVATPRHATSTPPAEDGSRVPQVANEEPDHMQEVEQEADQLIDDSNDGRNASEAEESQQGAPSNQDRLEATKLQELVKALERKVTVLEDINERQAIDMVSKEEFRDSVIDASLNLQTLFDKHIHDVMASTDAELCKVTERMSAVELTGRELQSRIKQVEERQDGMDATLTNVGENNAEVGKVVESLDQRIQKLAESIIAIEPAELHQSVKDIREETRRIQQRLDNSTVETALNAISAQIDGYAGQMEGMRQQLQVLTRERAFVPPRLFGSFSTSQSRLTSGSQANSDSQASTSTTGRTPDTQ